MLAATRWIILSICPPESWVYTEAFMSFTHVHCPDGLNNTLMSKGCSHQMAPTAETVGRRWNTVSLVLVMVSCGSSSGHILSMTNSTICSGHLTDQIEAHCFSTTFDYFLDSSLVSPFCSSKWLMQLRLENQDLGQCSSVRLHIRITGEFVST